MATSWLQPKTALQALILLVACGCTPFESHGPAHEGTELEALAPIGTAYKLVHLRGDGRMMFS